jgi:hypothetical protein
VRDIVRVGECMLTSSIRYWIWGIVFLVIVRLGASFRIGSCRISGFHRVVQKSQRIGAQISTQPEAETMSKLVKIPAFSRAKALARLVRRPAEDFVKMIAYRHKRSYFLHSQGVWFRFLSVNDMIVPFSVAQTYGKAYKGFKNVMVDTSEPEKVPALLPPKGRRTPVIAILGHFDHGKTTMLDYLGKTRIQHGEVGGITQV